MRSSPEDFEPIFYKEGSGINFKDIDDEKGPYARTPEEITLESRGEKKKRKLRGDRANEVSIVALKDDGSGIFKPEKGEAPGFRRAIEAGTYYKRERAAYLVDKLLDFGLVPPTVIRDIDGDIGSFQQFIPGAKAGWEVDSKELQSPELRPELVKLWIFDHIIFNSDRHDGNFLVKESQVAAIDHGLAFGNSRLLTYENYVGEPIPQEVIDKINNFLERQDLQDILRDLLLELLSQDEVDAFFVRVKRIADFIKGGSISLSELKNIQQFN